MKIAAKVFLILGMILWASIALIFGLLMATASAMITQVLAGMGLLGFPGLDPSTIVIAILVAIILVAVVQIILSIVSLMKLKSAQNKRQLIVWGILIIVFGNPLAGIFMLCLRDSDFEAPVEENVEPAN